MTTAAADATPVDMTGQGDRRLVILSRALLAIALAAVATGLVWGHVLGTVYDEEYFLAGEIPHLLTFLANAIVALLILSRHPRHTVGWVLLAASFISGLGKLSYPFTIVYLTGLAGSDSLLASFFVWLGLWQFQASSTLSILVVAYYFPTGRVLSPRWRLGALTAWLSLLISVTGIAIHPGLFEWFPRPDINPLAIPNGAAIGEFLFNFVGLPLSLLSAAIALVSIVVRYRRAAGMERAQIKWVLYFIGVVMIYGMLQFVISMVTPPIVETIMYVFSLFLTATIPVSIGIAILQRGLYNINIIINRSLVYGSLTLLLAAVFVGGFAGIRALLEGILGSDQIVVAAVVPAVAVTALFNPARRRLRHFVDKRIYGIDLDYTQVMETLAVEKSDTLTSFGDYTRLERVGRGGMGEVYRGHDPQANRPVAIKILPVEHQEKAELLRRFSREAQTVAALDHPNIVKLYEVGTRDDVPFMVMEYVDGQDLSELLREQGRLAANEVLPMLTEIASALDYAHGQGIVHRDIKPSNVMLEASTNRTVLMDFGVARIASAITQLTGTGGMVGTLDYISPEQIQGAKDIDGRADVYSLGTMAFQLLAGQPPFKKGNPAAMVMAHLMEPPPNLLDIVPGAGDNLSEALQTAMAKKPDDRFPTASAFVAAM